MKKLLIGCGVVMLIIFALCAGGSIYVGMKARSFVSGYEDAFARLEQLDERYPYAPPADGVIPEEKFEDYLDIRDELFATLSQQPALKRFIAFHRGEGEPPGVRDVFALISVPRIAMEELGKELDENRMSFSEYLYITQVVYASIYDGIESGDLEWKAIHDRLDESTRHVTTSIGESPGEMESFNVEEVGARMKQRLGAAAAANHELVEKYRERLLENSELSILEMGMIMEAMESYRPAPTPTEAP